MGLDYTLCLPCSLTYTGSLSVETRLTVSTPLQTKVKSTNFSSPGTDNSAIPEMGSMSAASSGKVLATVPLTIHDKVSPPSVVQVKVAVELMQTVVFTGGTRMTGAVSKTVT